MNKEWNKQNPTKVKDKARKYSKSDKGRAYYNQSNANRRSRRVNATPAWLTRSQKDQIKSLYKLATTFERLCGVKYHVDHIAPLKGENICGLHVPWNLQLMVSSLNISKGNKHGEKIR